jgi:putative transposase
MVGYRRNFLPGGTFFFTVTLRDRHATFLTDHIELLRDATRSVRDKLPFEIIAVVVLPDHLHAVWQLPENDADYATRWRLIKSSFTKGLKAAIPHAGSGRESVWQNRYWEHTIRDDLDLQRHVDYVHWNPVKHGHVAHAVDWPYSSIHRFIREGLLAADWGVREVRGEFGE